MKKSLVILLAVLVLAVGLLVSCDAGNTPTALTLSAEGDVTTLAPGQSVQLLVNGAVPEAGAYTFAFDTGAAYATVSDTGLLQVADNAAGKSIVLHIERDGKAVSNGVGIEVVAPSVPATSVTIAAKDGKKTLPPAGFVTLLATVLPENATDTVSFVLVSGEHCSLSGNTLTIDENAADGSVIRVKAVAGDVSSEILEITVKVPVTDNYWMNLQTDEITVDSGASTATKKLTATVYNGTARLSDAEMTEKGLRVEYAVKSGDAYIALDGADLRSVAVRAIGHGTAEIIVTLKKGDADLGTAETVSVHAINAPDRIDLPAWLIGKKTVNFTVGMGVENALTYLPVIAGSGSYCDDYTVIFEKLVSGEYVSGSSAASYDKETNRLIFAEEGTVRMTVVSASGSEKIVRSEFVFHVNRGKNVSTFEELKSVIGAGSGVYKGTPVNMVNTEAHGDYGYSFVPAYILNGAAQTQADHLATQITVHGGDLYLNGNGYAIDISGMQWVGATTDYGNLLHIGGVPVAGTTQADHRVIINRLTIIGNSSVDGRVGGHEFDESSSVGSRINRLNNSFYRGIMIAGGEDTSNPAKTMYTTYEVNLDGLHLEGFSVGVRVLHAVGNSKISDTTVENCYTNGVELEASLITLEDMDYGLCGAAGVEITPDNCDKAGLLCDQNQTVTFAGSIKARNINDGNTRYFGLLSKQYAAALGGDISIPNIILGTLQTNGMVGSSGFDPSATNIVSPVLDASGNPTGSYRFNFIALKFNDIASGTVNTSVIQYSGEFQNGLAGAADNIGQTDTEHQYIILSLVRNLGDVILYNFNYKAN